MAFNDYLAAHRTYLANERTWLAYMRTALTFFVAGVSFLQFFDSEIVRLIGWIFIPVGILFLIIGFWQFLKVRGMIRDFKQKNNK